MVTISLSSNSSSFIILTKPSLSSSKHNQIFLHQHPFSLRFNPISCTSNTNTNTNTKDNDNDNDATNSVTAPLLPGDVEVRFRRRSRRKSRQERENGSVSSSVKPLKEKAAPKKWDDMSLSEKAIELYVGEKGALFWLNKFAYASIFIMIGAWIVFRFVGPALNLYQLDAPPLSPTDVLKGSS
ncbi:hypothetical protein TanjilG_28246 [Lupinus angustifolius]|uniref:Uncharacterized protein n=1 Tax=Lupinus angustifolius TaxID=3871 RepID=A0A4P1RF08_LUPAN|nr:PREDICTED: uncharacterized protein LOC109350169 [Lupinus angustifolius]XP_019446877.1 PREDICTED: uncharacterized protein LOC109350169 [Lupinus angustifolius]XP_019446878.1 PREDICTED: uncharacterized protein LOC109350169 [Lupinus angustifolius]XP_019446879.1 PREDICTED: uncharacterized protein LOC109350169 [Lupinus angustifolius]OIW09647.1 hypothetical protein TanjilG_28246 [Lupinus angustifolius]